jgi:hypothetical protein
MKFFVVQVDRLVYHLKRDALFDGCCSSNPRINYVMYYFTQFFFVRSASLRVLLLVTLTNVFAISLVRAVAVNKRLVLSRRVLLS